MLHARENSAIQLIRGPRNKPYGTYTRVLLELYTSQGHWVSLTSFGLPVTVDLPLSWDVVVYHDYCTIHINYPVVMCDRALQRDLSIRLHNCLQSSMPASRIAACIHMCFYCIYGNTRVGLLPMCICVYLDIQIQAHGKCIYVYIPMDVYIICI